MVVVGLDNPLHQGVTHDILVAEPGKADPLDVLQDIADVGQPGL